MIHNFLKKKILRARREMEFYHRKERKREETFKGQFCEHQTQSKFKELNKDYIECKAEPRLECPYNSFLIIIAQILNQ